MSAEEATAASLVKPPRKLGRRILVALVLGLLTGLFFGELAGPLRAVGDAFIGLLQMTVLPYIIVALILNIGRLSPKQAGMLFRYGVVTLLLLWGIGLLTIAVMAHAFPPMETGSFFSTKIAAAAEAPSLLGLFIPFNVFDALVKDIVPAVVVFCLFLGVALLHVPKKERLLEALDVFSEALMRVNTYVARLTPIGVFAMVASAAGTLTVQEFGRIQGYLLAYTLLVGLLTFLVLPAVITALTPFGYRQVMRACSTPMMTAFATGKVIIVLPMLVEHTQHLFRETLSEATEGEASVDVLYPLAYPFPHLGKLASLLFVPFAAWFVGKPLALLQIPVVLGAGLVSMFGGPIVTIPFLLDLAEVPADLMQLFLVSGIWASRVGDLLGVMHLAAFTLITASAMSGIVRFRPRKALPGALVSVGAVAASIAVCHVVLNQTFVGSYQRTDVLASMHSLEQPRPYDILHDAGPHSSPVQAGESRLDRIRRTQVIRVGFHPRRRPFSFLNVRGDLVGFDIDMAHELARDFDLALEFVPVEVTDVPAALSEDRIDIAMMGLFATMGRAFETELTESYLGARPALVTTAALAPRLDSVDEIVQHEGLRLACSDDTLLAWIQRRRPNLSYDLLEDEEAFFTTDPSPADALLTSAEAGSAWTLAYPDYRVVVPRGATRVLPLAYPLPKGETALRRFLDRWLETKRAEGRLDGFYEHWILGRLAGRDEPRWSVLRDVLHWVE